MMMVEDPIMDSLRQSTTDVQHNNMVVAVCVRPLSPKEEAAGLQSCCKVLNQKIVMISKAGNPSHYLRSQQGSINEYAFDVAFDGTSTQAEVYQHTAKRHVPSVLDGYNVTVFAYGATGAGKTHTMMGSERNGEGQDGCSVSGIIPESLVDIFDSVRARREAVQGQQGREEWRVFASFLEVYNEQIYDLVAGGRMPLAVREDSQRGVVQVAGLSEIEVGSTNEVLELLRQGNRSRKTESTAANQVSSRSHAVLQLNVRHAFVDGEGKDVVRESKLSLIDLAGSERASATQNRGVRLQEGANINKSLLALANCINALAENGSKHMRKNVKYRDSKLTHLLKTSLEGDCKLIMIANINPAHHVFEDSHNTLKYANRAKNIKIKSGTAHLLTQDVPWHIREARLRADNDKLREELEYLRQCVGHDKGAAPSSMPTPMPTHHHGEAFAMVDDHNSSLSTSFLSTCESMEIDDQTAASPGTQDDSIMQFRNNGKEPAHGRRMSTRRASQLIPMSSPPNMVAGSSSSSHQQPTAGRDVNDMMQEMARTREFMQSLIESLTSQKATVEAQLQAQRQETQSWQRQAQEKDQEIARLREHLVELRTRLEQAGQWQGQGGAAVPSADAMDLGFSPINPPPSREGARGSALKANPLTSPSAAKKASSRRRMSKIPQPQFNPSTRRASVMPPMATLAHNEDEDAVSVTKPPANQLPNSLLSSGKKRPRNAWAPGAGNGQEGGKENKAPRTRRESLMPKSMGMGRMAGNDATLAPRMTRSRASMLPTPGPNFCF